MMEIIPYLMGKQYLKNGDFILVVTSETDAECYVDIMGEKIEYDWKNLKTKWFRVVL